MSRFYDLVTDHVRTLGRYTPGKPVRQAEQESGVTCLKLASNENPFGPSPRAVESMRREIGESHFYPDNDASELRSALAQKHGVAVENVLVGAGSTSLLEIIARTLVGPGLNAVIGERSFIVYPIATKAAGGSLKIVPMRNDGFDLDAMAAAVDAGTRVIFLANPNNPTGTLVDADAVDRFLAKIPPTVTVVLDEAYYDFAEYFAQQRGITYTRSLDYVTQGRNVVVLRTFSKAHGLAGVRVGYGIGPSELLGYFARLRTTFAVSNLAQAAGLAALADEDHVRKALANNAEQVEFLANGISRLGCRVVPTWANFLYCDVSEPADDLTQRLQDEGVIVRSLRPWRVPEAIRVTIGTPQQNEVFLRALQKVRARVTAH
jgi:histidinol-phosphate aminotransferase